MRYDELLFARHFEDWSGLSADRVRSLLRVKLQHAVPSIDAIDLSKPQRVKMGIDPTGADVHIGHLVPMMILNLFAKCGHHVDFLLGDFTAKVGDPSGRVAERVVISDAEITKNYKTYAKQAGRYIQIDKFRVVRNSTWLNKLGMTELLRILQQINLAQSLQREDFRKRLETGGITMAELMYSVLVGYDSVALKSTVELGGLDQLLNLQMGRDMQKMYGQDAQVAICNPLLDGTDGRKMSKSYNNYIPLTASAEDKFGKLMSIPDNLIINYFKCFGYLYEEELPTLQAFIEKHPMEAKKQLATFFVSIEAKNMQGGLAERARFEKKFSKRELVADDFIEICVPHGTSLLDALMLSGKFKSMGELKRLQVAGAVKDLGEGKYKVGKLNHFVIVGNGK